MLATYMQCISINSLAIRIVGSSCSCNKQDLNIPAEPQTWGNQEDLHHFSKTML